jgi:hypothetical protein
MSDIRHTLLGLTRSRERTLARQALQTEEDAANADDPRLLDALGRTAREPGIVLGRTERHTRVRALLRELRGMHLHVTGASGSGKSFVVASLIRDLLRLQHEGLPIAIIVFVCQGFLGDIALGLRAAELATQSHAGQRGLLDRTHVHRFFRGGALTPWQLIAAEPSIATMVQAGAQAEVLEQVLGARFGGRQELLLTNLLALAIVNGWTLLELRAYLSRPEELARQGMRCPIAEVAAYFRERFLRESRTTIDGVRSQLDLLLRDPALRAVLSGPTRFDLGRSFAPGALSVIDVSGAVLALEGARAIASLMLLSIAFQTFDPRRERNASVFFVTDELQQALSPVATRVLCTLLETARAHDVSVTACHQGLFQLPAALAESLATNARHRLLFRASRDEARAQLDLLSSRVGAGTRGATDAARIEFATRMPSRRFIYTDRGAPFGPTVLDAEPFVPFDLRTLSPELLGQLERGATGVDRASLIAHAEAQETRAFAAGIDARAWQTPDVLASRRPR